MKYRCYQSNREGRGKKLNRSRNFPVPLGIRVLFTCWFHSLLFGERSIVHHALRNRFLSSLEPVSIPPSLGCKPGDTRKNEKRANPDRDRPGRKPEAIE